MPVSNESSYSVYIHPDIKEKDSLVEDQLSNVLLRELVEVTHGLKYYDRLRYVKVIQDICKAYHLSKGDSEFYPSPFDERRHNGEYFCDFDDGKPNVILYKLRIQPESGVIILSTLYVEEKYIDHLSMQDVNNLGLMLHVITSFISRVRMQRTIETMVFHDELGLPNFRFCMRGIRDLNEQNKLHGMVAVHFDLHNFSMVNADVGRKNGDSVLQNVFVMLKEAAGKDSLFGRLGGDKFVGLFPFNRLDDVLNILKGAAVPYGESGGDKIFVSAGTGVYIIPDDFVFRSPGDIMNRITMASLVAKKREEAAIVFYDKEMEVYNIKMKQFQKNFRESLENEDFKILYQPKVDINTNEIIGAEALSRWLADGKLVFPAEYVPILEQNTDICALDFYMLSHACKDIRRRLDEGKKVVRVSVNFSRKHLLDMNLLERILRIIDDNNVPHEYIEVELTETTTDVKFRDLKRVVNGLKEVGIRVAVDDFGVGYSSMNLIREIPWDVLKVDRCFLPEDEGDDRTYKATLLMFHHVVSMAHELGMECVVEGVETKKQLDLLHENNCEIAQGYYFDKPLEPEEFEKRLSKGFY